MVERSVCNVEGENNTSRSVSGNVQSVVCRNEDLQAPEVTGSFEKSTNSRKSREACLNNPNEPSKLTVSRDSGSKGIPTVGGKFSLFKWFKRGSRDTADTSWRHQESENPSNRVKCDRDCSDLDENEITSDELSSNESVETLYSTATVRSFAFKIGTPGRSEVISENSRRQLTASLSHDFTDGESRRVGPFGVGASKIVTNLDDTSNLHSTKTLPANVASRRLDITARYSLQSCNGFSGGFGSCGNFTGDKEDWVKGSRIGENLERVRVHVRGKRRAPDPPEVTIRQRNAEEPIRSGEKKRRGKRRQAPKPPDVKFDERKVSINLTPEKETESALLPLTNDFDDSAAIRGTGKASATVKEENVSEEKDDIIKSGLSDKEGITSTSSKIGEVPKNTDLSEVEGSSNTEIEANRTDGLLEVERVANTTGMNVGKIDIENNGSEAIEKVNEGILTKGRFKSSENLEKNLPTVSNDVEKFDEPATLSSDKTLTHTKPERVVAEQSKNENSSFLQSTSDNGDLTRSTPRNESETLIDQTKNAIELAGSISNDSLVLQGGVLHSKRDTNSSLPSGVILRTTETEGSLRATRGGIFVVTGSQTSTAAMPRPWYKRNVFEHSRDSGTSRRNEVLRNSTYLEAQNDAGREKTISPIPNAKLRNFEKNHDGGTLGRLNFFHKNEKITDERKKENNKRKSGLTMLANISELDKEAAAIVQEEQARARAAAKLLQASKTNVEKPNDEETEDVVQEIVSSVMESSPRRGTRALISKFNAISNRTRVTVNTSFFAKNSSARDEKMEKIETPKNPRENEWRDCTKFSRSENIRTDKDLSRYFLPAQKSVKTKKIETQGESSKEITWKNSNDVSARLSFFQSITGEKKIVSELREKSFDTKMASSSEKILSENVGNANVQGAPNISKLDVLKDESTTSHRDETIEKTIKDSAEKKIGKENHEKINDKNRELMQKEFSDIFREIDEKLSSREFGVVKNEKTAETSTSSRVSKVLDILVEAEQNDRTNFSRTNGENDLTEKNDKTSKVSSTSGPSVNPQKADLREMLKEMKHSLPKRPKQKRTCDREITSRYIDATPVEKRKELISGNDERRQFFSSANDRSNLLSPVKVIYPPPIRIAESASIVDLERTDVRRRDERDYERQKVSSAAQTSGNLRKLTDLVGREKTSKWQNEDVIYRTSGKGIAATGTSGLTKNTFQLIRPREFARIEAIKTMKNPHSENTYANVMDQSIYANALVTANEKKNCPESPRNDHTRRHIFDEKKIPNRSEETMEIATMAPDLITPSGPQNMNTLAVNRLLRKLEAAIASGHHQQAAGLAKELARLKIHCSVVRQRTEKKDLINVNMYIEDKLAHQGPIPLRLTRGMTVAQLKAKVFTEFEIPVNVQRWIVGKNLANDDSTRLVDLQAVEGSSVFLYLVAPEAKIDEAPLHDEKVTVPEPEPQKDFSPKEFDKCTKLLAPEESVEIQRIEDELEEENEKCISEEARMERYEALISLENCDVIPNSEPIECPICFVTYGPQEGVILRDCLHIFCRPCIANTIRYCEEAEVKCPYRDTEYTCESTLQEREIKALVEPEVYQQHLAKSIAQAENNAGNNAFHCKTPDCPGWCIYDDNVNNFLCPVCGANNCLTCQVVHTGKNCRQYQEELRMSKETDQESKRTAAMLEEMVDRGEALPCPTCAVVLMKKWGCDWLRCSMCKTEICWVTRGPRWGPGGKGDTSGGCRCGEKGVKCHPRCNYCH